MMVPLATISHRLINPLKKVSKELLEHGEVHSARNSPLDRLLAGVHVDNALELFLKFYGAKHNIPGYKRKLVPELTRLLEPHIPELAEFGGDLRTFHDLRDVAYHMGLPLDEYNLNWGLERIKSFIIQVEHRERLQTTREPDGGSYMHKQSKAEKELETALRFFQQLPSDAQKEQIETVLLHMFRAVEHWLDDTLEQKNLVEKQKIPKMALSKKIKTIREEIKDPILLKELWRINTLRNKILHAKEVRIPPNEVYRYLLTLMHFIKVESPSEYRVPVQKPSHKTLTGVFVKSKSEVIIANILSCLRIDYEYERPLPSRSDPGNARVPDFTITYKGKEFYWEHISRLTKQYKSLWKRKQRWYEENNYGNRLIVSKETANGAIDSEKIKRMVEEKILKT